jgi:hypothetical protein
VIVIGAVEAKGNVIIVSYQRVVPVLYRLPPDINPPTFDEDPE